MLDITQHEVCQIKHCITPSQQNRADSENGDAQILIFVLLWPWENPTVLKFSPESDLKWMNKIQKYCWDCNCSIYLYIYM